MPLRPGKHWVAVCDICGESADTEVEAAKSADSLGEAVSIARELGWVVEGRPAGRGLVCPNCQEEDGARCL